MHASKSSAAGHINLVPKALGMTNMPCKGAEHVCAHAVYDICTQGWNTSIAMTGTGVINSTTSALFEMIRRSYY